jgi:hypothetical protein
MVKANDPNNFPKGFYEYLNSPIFSREALKGISALSDSLKIYAEQNKSIVDQVIKASTLRSSMLEGMKLSALPEASRIIASQSNLNAYERIKLSPIFGQVNAANLSISKLLREVDSSNISKLIQQTTLQSPAWKKQFQAIDKIAGVSQRYDLVIQSHLAEVSKFSALSQISLSHLALEGVVGNALKVELSIQSALQRTFTDFATSYSKLFASLSDNPASVISLPPVVSRYSAVEFFNGVRVAESVTVESDEFELESELEEETHQLEKDIQQETESILEKLLERLNVELIVPLNGARHSLESTNPDKVRHFATSLRELFTHVLHALSPDDQVKSWSNSPKHFDRGKPTRRARLLYICRSLNHDPFSDFLEKDIDAVLEFLKLFQRGTHEIIPTYTDFQLKMMLVRMESALRFLLEIWWESNVL